MWKHSGIEDTVFGIIFTIVLLFEGRKGTCILCVDEWLDIVCVVRPRVNENVSIVVISICISQFSYIIALFCILLKNFSVR